MNEKQIAAVSCSPDAYRLGGVKMGLGTTGKLCGPFPHFMDGDAQGLLDCT